MRNTALSIIKKLQKAGYEAYFAGGAVRDMLQGKSPKDIDIATSAKPEEIEKLLDKTIPIGKKFGVILVLLKGHQFQIATFRSEYCHKDGRRPESVKFTCAKEDALRRDFTVNGMFYDPIKNKLLDFVHGQKDLKKGVVRFIGDPHERILEDHLRILRAIRFKNRFGFDYCRRIKKALKTNAHLITKISGERIGEELTKIFLDPSRTQALKDLSELGILKYILPEVENLKGVAQPSQYHLEGDVFEHTCNVLAHIPKRPLPTKQLIFAALLHDIGKPETFTKQKGDRIRFNDHAHHSALLANKICRRLCFSRLEQTKICWLIEHHMHMLQIIKMRLAHQRRFMSHLWFKDLLQLHRVDALGSQPVDLSLYNKIKKLYNQSHPLMLLKANLINGQEIMNHFNLPPSPLIGELKEKIHDRQIEGKIKNREEAWEYLEKIYKAH